MHAKPDDVAAPAANLLAFGAEAAAGIPVEALLTRACEEVAEGLGVSHAKVLQFRPDEETLLVAAGIGWADDVVGRARLSPALQSPAGYALQTGLPTIANDLATERRFAVPELLESHGVRSAVNVIIRSGERVYGVLEADSRAPREFDERDVHFLQGYANVLALAVDQHRMAEQNATLSENLELALHELRHRTRNNNQMLLSVLAIQQRRQSNVVVRSVLEDISGRIRTLTDLDEAMLASGDVRNVDVGRYLVGIVANICNVNAERASHVSIATDVAQIAVDTQRARALGLIVNEFVTNSFKHAFTDETPGSVALHLAAGDSTATLTLEDDGPGFERDDNPGFGLHLIETLGNSLGGLLVWHTCGRTELRVEFPISAAAPAGESYTPPLAADGVNVSGTGRLTL